MATTFVKSKPVSFVNEDHCAIWTETITHLPQQNAVQEKYKKNVQEHAKLQADICNAQAGDRCSASQAEQHVLGQKSVELVLKHARVNRIGLSSVLAKIGP